MADGDRTPGLGAFLVLVLVVTSSFVIVFQQTLPEAVATTLSWVVIGVSAVSAMMGFVLEALSYFDRDGGAEPTAPADPTPTTSSRPWVPDGDVKPLPPLINFDDELEQLYDYFDGEFPSQAETFLEGYKRMKTADRGQRGTIASDVRAGLNPIIVLVDDPEVESMLSQMGEDLFAYVKTDGAELVSVDRYALYDDGRKTPVDDLRGQRGSIASDVRAGLNPIVVLVDDPEIESMLSRMGEDLFAYVKTDGAELVNVDRYALYDDGKKAPVDELQGRQARIRASVSNDGESMKTDVLLRFTDGDGIEVKRTKLPVGEVPTAATKELNTQVYVPSVASSVTVSPVPAAASREVLDM